VKRQLYHISFVTLIAFLLFSGGSAFGQQDDKSSSGQSQNDNQNQNGQRRGRRGAMQRQRQHMAMISEKLGLSDQQKAQFQKIARDTRQQATSIRQDSSLNDDQKKEKIQALRKQQHQQMFTVLTDEQKQKLKEMREQHMKDQNKDKGTGDQASAKKPGVSAGDDDDPFAGMTSDDDDGPSGRL